MRLEADTGFSERPSKRFKGVEHDIAQVSYAELGLQLYLPFRLLDSPASCERYQDYLVTVTLRFKYSKRFAVLLGCLLLSQLRLSEFRLPSQQRLPTWWETSVAVDANLQPHQSELPPKRTSSQTEPSCSLQTWAHAVQDSITLAERCVQTMLI